MRLGALLHQLWRHKGGVAACLAFAVLMSLWSLYHLSVFPPGLKARHLQIGAAATTVLVDAPKSKVVDLRANTQDLQSLTTRADLLSNVMASSPVRLFIARRAGVPINQVVATASLGTDLPRSALEPGSERRSSDLIRETDLYRLAISVNPAQPLIYVNSQAPTADGASRLANAAVDGLNDYLTMMADREGIAPPSRTRLIQFGRAQGGIVNPSVNLEIGLLTFLISFVVACAAFRVVLRVRHGWALDAARERREGKNWWLPKLDPAPTVPTAPVVPHEPD
jgi:hypothetical protein